jgi:antitoxin component of MazEF toxin-antitoxin module
MYERNVYVVQPYKVGTKERKSLAIVIPAQVVKEYSFNPSTVFALNVEKDKITLRTLDMDTERPFVTRMLPALTNQG